MVFSPHSRGPTKVRARFTHWTHLSVLPLSCLVSSLVFGCDDDGDSSALPGELGSSHFFYSCTTLDDVQCRRELSSFPDFIAVGGKFELLSDRDLISSLFIKPASPLIVTAAAGEFEFQRPGVSAFLAINSNDELKDFVHLSAVPVEEIQVEGTFGDRITEVSLEAGRQMTLIAVPLGNDEELAGSLSFRWATDSETVVRVPRRGTEIRLEALSAGTALVRVELDDVSTTLQVTVSPSDFVPLDAGATPDADAGDASTLDAATRPQDGGLDAGSTSSDASALSDAETPSGSDSTTSDSTVTDASIPTDAAIASDAQIQAEAGDL